MTSGMSGEHTLMGVAAVIAAIASLVSAVGTYMNGKKLKDMQDDHDGDK